MRTLSRCAYSLLALVAAALLSGCGQKTISKSKTYSVSGKITYKGEPARYVLVRFNPTGGKGAEAKGRTDGEGHFELNTYSNEGDNDGAVPGEYNVVLIEFDPIRGGDVPKGAKATRIEGGEVKLPDTYEIKDEDNNLTIDVP